MDTSTKEGEGQMIGRGKQKEKTTLGELFMYLNLTIRWVVDGYLPEHALLCIIYSRVFVRSNDVDHLVGDGGETCWYLCYLRASKLFHLQILICTGTCVLQIWNSLLYCLSWSTKVIKQSLLSYHIYCFVFFFSLLNVTSLVIKYSPVEKYFFIKYCQKRSQLKIYQLQISKYVIANSFSLS